MTRSTATADLILHPVRLRIIQALLGDRRLTTAQIAGELSDVSTATLYRQIATLVAADVLEVVQERRIRGAVERTYALRTGAAVLGDDDVARMTPDDHRRGFAAFVAGLLSTFDTYLDTGDIDLVRDRVGYRQRAFWLTDAELDALVERVRALYQEVADLGPGEGRRRRVFTTVTMPGGQEHD